MDNGYAGFDQAMMRPATSHNPHESFLRPSGSNTQLHSGLYDAVARIKCEEVASGLSGIFSRAAAQLHDKALKLPELSFNSSTACDLRAIRAPVASFSPIFDTADFLASSNSFNFLGSSECIPGCHSSVFSKEHTAEKGVKQEAEVDEFKLATHTVSSSNFPGSMLHASELFQAVLATLPANGVHSSPPALLRSSTEGIPSTLRSCPITPSDAEMAGSISDSTNSPSKQDSPVQSAEDSDADPKFQSNNSKRRKTQQKRVVCVPINESKQKGETPPSDLWAWRKYGQKPIKGSPYPRGYYRCSSSKGCSARKQVERSRSDPTMLMVTYTSDHNHTWPANRSSSAAANRPPKGSTRGHEEPGSSDIAENLFASIINSPNAVDEQVVSSLDALCDEESFTLQRDVDLCLSRTTTEEDDVFDDLGELPELSAIFNKGFLEERSNDEGDLNSMGSCNPGSISSWSCAALIEEL